MLFQRRIVRELMWNAVTTILVLMAVIMLVMCAKIVHQIEGLDMSTFALLLPIFATTAINLMVPVAVLVATVLTYSRAAADNEITTLRASGVHPWHMYVPGLVFGAVWCVFLIWCMDDGMPFAEQTKRRLTKEVNPANIIKNKLSSGEPVELDDRTVIAVDLFDEQGKPQGLRIQFFTEPEDDEPPELEREIRAESGDIVIRDQTNQIELHLFDFRSTKGSPISGKKTILRRALPRGAWEYGIEDLGTHQLVAWLTRPERDRKGFDSPEVQASVHSRLAIALACVVFVLIGIPIALMFRSGDRVAGFLVAFLVALFLYFPSIKISEALSEEAMLPAAWAAWSGNALLLVIAAGLNWRVLRR